MEQVFRFFITRLLVTDAYERVMRLLGDLGGMRYRTGFLFFQSVASS